MVRVPFRAAMFLSSYAPLFALLAFSHRESQAAWIGLVAVVAVSVAGLAVVLLAHRGDRGPRLRVAHAKPQDGDVLAYLATYLLPFLGLDLHTLDDLVTLGGFLAVLMVLYINSSMIFVNPILSLIGYRYFELQDPEGHVYALLTRRRVIEPESVLTPTQIIRYLRVEVGRER